MAARRQPQPQTRRVNRGKGHSYLVDGQKADGVTWVISQGIAKPALTNWAARTVAQAAVEQRDKWEDMSEGAAVEWLRQSPYNDRDKAANKGTKVHNLAEALARGDEVEVPEELTGHVDSYLQFRTDWQPEHELLELVVVNRRHRYMGTLDIIARLADGLTWLLDIKTNRSGPFGEVALQLAAYAHAETYLGPDGDEVDMPAIDRCGALWVRADGYDLYPFTADESIFRSFLYAQQVAHFVQDTSRTVKGEAIYPREEMSA